MKLLAAIARDGFGTEITEDDARHHILDVDFLHLIHDSAGNVAGFAGYNRFSVNGMDILYLSGAVIKKRTQNKGLASASIRFAMESTNAKVLTLRTQNPIMYETAKHMMASIYPSIGYGSASELELAKEIGAETARRLDSKRYDRDSFVARGTYATALNDEIPEITDKQTKELFEKLEINRQGGDSIIVVGFAADAAALLDHKRA